MKLHNGIYTLSERRPPKPLVSAGIEGWLEWELIDRAGRTARGGQQHNLLLNQGLDLMTERDVWNTVNTHSFVSHAVVGTGSVEPDVTDTAMANELARTSSMVGNPLKERLAERHYRMTTVFQFDYGAANGNLTEWGMATASTGNLAVRELIRDTMGNPIVLTKTNEYLLRLTYVMEFTLTPASQAVSFVVTGVNGDAPLTGTAAWRGADDAQTTLGFADIRAFSQLLRGQVGPRYDGNVMADDLGMGAYEDPITVATTNASITPKRGTASFTPFTPGVWERAVNGVWGPADSVGTIRRIVLIGAGQDASGIQARALPGFTTELDVPSRFVKDNEHRLTINDVLRVTWGRA